MTAFVKRLVTHNSTEPCNSSKSDLDLSSVHIMRYRNTNTVLVIIKLKIVSVPVQLPPVAVN